MNWLKEKGFHGRSFACLLRAYLMIGCTGLPTDLNLDTCACACASVLSSCAGILVAVDQDNYDWWAFLDPFDKSFWTFFIFMCTLVPLFLW